MALDPVLNFAKVTVSTGYDDSATSIVLSSGHGALLPDPSSAGAFNLVWWNFTDYPDPADDPNKEIVRCIARSNDTLTVTRNQESSGASTKNTGGKVYKMILSMTKKMKDDIESLIPAIPSATAGPAIISSSDAEKMTTDTQYIIAKEIYIGRPGTYSVFFQIRNDSGFNTAYGKIYKNGGAVGTQRTNVNQTYTEYSEDLAFVAGDLCQLYYGETGGASCYVRYFRLCCSNPYPSGATLN